MSARAALVHWRFNLGPMVQMMMPGPADPRGSANDEMDDAGNQPTPTAGPFEQDGAAGNQTAPTAGPFILAVMLCE